jgi:cytochrome c oxidase subunit 2
MLDDPFSPNLTIKTIGHQWYWSYEYSDFPDIEFRSYIIPFSDLKRGSIRLLETDNNLILPVNNQIRMIVRATDVIHSWTIPALGVKVDAVPGRLNQIIFNLKHVGVFFGQCSEICGANHRFIPIKLEAIPIKNFINWVNNFNSLDGWV